MKSKFSRFVTLLVVLSMTLTLVAGCGAKKEVTKTEDVKTEEAKTEKQTEKQADKKEVKRGPITLMASQNWIKEVDRELFKDFEKETGIEVKILLTPDNGYSTLLGTSLSGGSSAIDIFMHSGGSEMISTGLPDVALELSNEEWASRLEDWAISSNSYEDKLYGFSTWGIDYEGILYNKTYFEENNLEVPNNWNDFMALLDKIKELGKTPLYENINGVWHTQSWLYGMTPALLQDNPNFINELNQSADKKLASNEKLKEGLTELSALFSAKENGVPKYYTNDGQSEDWFGSYPSLLNRETVMLFTYSAYVAELEAKGTSDEWGMFPLPVLGNKQGVSNGGGISKFINKNSKNIEACKMLFDFLAKSENLEKYYSARKDLVSASFKGVKAVKPTSATSEMIERSGSSSVPTMMIKEVLYWDPDIYKYFQKIAESELTVEEFLTNMDNYRATLFEAAAN